MHNFKKLMDTPECDILFEQYPDAFILMTIIAKKARQNDSLALMGLSKGQAFITDYKKFGLTESRYRKAKKQLEKFGFASFTPTNRGTIATIDDTRIYDVNKEQDNEQTAVKQQPETKCEKINRNDEPGDPNFRTNLNAALELNAMFREKVVTPLRRELARTAIEEIIEPLIIESFDKKENIAYLFHRKDNSVVNDRYRDKIEKKLGMGVRLVNGAG